MSLECDSHADKCCIGRDALVRRDYDQPVQVYAYDPNLGSQMFRTVSAEMAYTHPADGRGLYLLVIHQAIEIPHLGQNLLCPMQCRVNNIEVNETSRFLSKRVTKETHVIVVPDPES